ncbi:hypothetical protein FRC07_007804 [Ceratobasidium sp. 392]|nr:hypothetical protein FRC07_007804 [Ceratobasidium sp. 392]
MTQAPTEDTVVVPRRKSEHTGPSSSSLLFAPQPPSPFPSPSSSFVPPPAQEAHEFANKTTARMAAAKSHSRRNSEDTKAPLRSSPSSPLPQPSPKLTEPSPLAASSSLQPLTTKRFSVDSAHESSLSSSRPAPASPALSRHSSLLHTGSRKRLSTLSIVSTSGTPAVITPVRRPGLIKVRDFAFPPGDERHTGEGPLGKRASIASSDSTDPWHSDEEEYESQEEPEEEEMDAFVPGTYRALYAFEPEGTAEMALVEDQHVRVLGRGGGVGWVVVLKPNGVEQALVPEGYLELVRADEEDEHEDEEGVDGATEAPRTPRAVS